MKLLEYEQSLETPLRQATITLLLKDDEVLLAMKKRGFGAGKWNGVGGKPNNDEDIYSAAIRESQEEIGVTPLNIKNVGILSFYFPLVPKEKSYDQTVLIFTATDWKGTPIESDEMKPKWFKIQDVPYNQMWVDDIVWMPKVFAGALIKGSFMFGENDKLVEHYINEVKSLD